TFVWTNTVAVRLERVGRFRQRVAYCCIHPPVATITKLRLQTVVIRDPEIHDHVNLPYATGGRQDGPRVISSRYALRLPLRGARKRRGRIQVDSAIEVGPMLVHVVRPEKHAF